MNSYPEEHSLIVRRKVKVAITHSFGIQISRPMGSFRYSIDLIQISFVYLKFLDLPLSSSRDTQMGPRLGHKKGVTIDRAIAICRARRPRPQHPCH